MYIYIYIYTYTYNRIYTFLHIYKYMYILNSKSPLYFSKSCNTIVLNLFTNVEHDIESHANIQNNSFHKTHPKHLNSFSKM